MGAPQYCFHCRQIHLLSIDQLHARKFFKGADGVIQPVIDVEPGLWQERHPRIRLVFKMGATRFEHPADIAISRRGKQMEFDHRVKMIGSFRVTTIVCSNCAAIALSIVRSDQPSFSSTTRPMPVVRNGSMARTSPSLRVR